MVVSNVGPFAKAFKVADVLVFGMAALPLSLTLSPLHQRINAAQQADCRKLRMAEAGPCFEGPVSTA
ncbi:MAG TPA: hypothetical protein VG270_02205 [Pseudolabrys sp.]|jgi:hypothetical protein|nr:hypothetical protein [Pseudolabrys sp.]